MTGLAGLPGWGRLWVVATICWIAFWVIVYIGDFQRVWANIGQPYRVVDSIPLSINVSRPITPWNWHFSSNAAKAALQLGDECRTFDTRSKRAGEVQDGFSFEEAIGLPFSSHVLECRRPTTASDVVVAHLPWLGATIGGPLAALAGWFAINWVIDGFRRGRGGAA